MRTHTYVEHALHAMGRDEQKKFAALYAQVNEARGILERANAGAPEQDESLRVACARLDDWLLENAVRWVA